MRVLVTGAAGFIGSHVLEALAAAGHEVRGLDSLSPAVHSGVPAYIPAGTDLRVADIRDRSAVEEALDGMDAVCHLAAMVGLGVSVADLPLYADVNVTGTAVLLAAMACKEVSRLVLSSSMVVYGEGAYECAQHGLVRPLPRSAADLDAGVFEPRCLACGGRLAWATVSEDAVLDPRNAYATSKLAQEHLAANWARATGGGAAALRYHNVYGPRMPRDTPYSGVAAIFRSALENGVVPRVFEDGGQLRDFVHVRDVADCNVLALNALAHGDGSTPRLPGGHSAAQRHHLQVPGHVPSADLAAAGGSVPAGSPEGVQRRERDAAHGQRDGGGTGSGLRRGPSAEGHWRVPSGRRPPHRGLAAGSGS